MRVLRQRTIDELKLFGYSGMTIKNYVEAVSSLARYHGKSPDTLSVEGIKTSGGALDKEKRAFRRRGVRRKQDGTKTRDFLVPVGPLRILFKNKFLSQLGKAYQAGTLRFPGAVATLSAPDAFYALKERLFQKTWVVFCKEPFAGPKQVLAYLGRYTHKTAISNSRLLSKEDGTVTFALKNCRKDGKREVMKLPAGEFLRRFLLHVLPKGYRRIRMFGFLSNRYKKENLERIRALLEVAPPKRRTRRRNRWPRSC